VALTPSIRRSLLPVISALHRAPLLAATPLVFIWLGFGVRSIVLLACLLASFTMIPGFIDGLGSASEDVLDLLRLAKVGAIRTFMKLRLPSSLPCAFAAMKTSIPLIVSVVAIGEFVDGQKGLAYLMLAAAFKLNTALVFAALAAVLALGLVLYGAVALIEVTLVRYRHS
jgi:NitT/TauT family transport system permease protein